METAHKRKKDKEGTLEFLGVEKYCPKNNGRNAILEHWDYVVNQSTSEKEYKNGVRDKDRGSMTLDDFMETPKVKQFDLSRPEVIALRLYTTLVYDYINGPMRNIEQYRATGDNQPKRHPLAAGCAGTGCAARCCFFVATNT